MTLLGLRMVQGTRRTPAPVAMDLRQSRVMVMRGPAPRQERKESTPGPTWDQFKSARNTTFRRLDRLEAAVVQLADCLGQGDEFHPRQGRLWELECLVGRLIYELGMERLAEQQRQQQEGQRAAQVDARLVQLEGVAIHPSQKGKEVVGTASGE